MPRHLHQLALQLQLLYRQISEKVHQNIAVTDKIFKSSIDALENITCEVLWFNNQCNLILSHLISSHQMPERQGGCAVLSLDPNWSEPSSTWRCVAAADLLLSMTATALRHCCA